MSGLNYIVDLASNDLLDNSMFVGRRELGRRSTMMVFFLWLDFLKDPSHSRLPYASLRCNFCAGKIKRSKRDDVIPLEYVTILPVFHLNWSEQL